MSPAQSSFVRIAATACLTLGAATCAQAQGYGGYGFAEPFVAGEYVGAPLTRIPRSYDLVPSAWGYGTYGIPTVAGIRRAPVGEPVVYVIDSPAPAARARASASPRILSRGRGGRGGRWSRMEADRMEADRMEAHAEPRRSGGARIVSLDAPRR